MAQSNNTKKPNSKTLSRLEFIKNDNPQNDRSLLYGRKIRNFIDYTTVLQETDKDMFVCFQGKLLEWFNTTNNTTRNGIIIEMVNNQWQVSTNSNNVGFQKYIISGIIKCLYEIRNETKAITSSKKLDKAFDKHIEQIPESFREFVSKSDFEDDQKKHSQPLTRNISEYILDKDIEKVCQMIEGSVPISNYIELFRNYRETHPKISFITFTIRNPMYNRSHTHSIPMEWLESSSSPEKIGYFLDRLVDDTNRLIPFQISLSTFRDPPMKELLETNMDLYDKLDFKDKSGNMDIWIQFLITIGRFGIQMLDNLMYFDTILHTIQTREEDGYNFSEFSKNGKPYYGKTIRKLYQFALKDRGLSKTDQLTYFQIVAECNEKDNYLFKRAKFCVASERFLNRLSTGKYSKSEKDREVARFKGDKQNNKYFSIRQEDNDYSYKFVKLINHV
jgi:hypothetical protein